MSTEFDSLTSLTDWSDKLVELLSASRAVAEQDDDARLAVARRLTDFVAHSYPASPEIRHLDELATAAARALTEEVSEDAMERLASRTALLEILAGELDTLMSQFPPPPSAGSVAEFAEQLTAAAEDAKALAGFRAKSGENPAQFRVRITRLAETLEALRAGVLASFPPNPRARPEPRSGSSGTVIADPNRSTP